MSSSLALTMSLAAARASARRRVAAGGPKIDGRQLRSKVIVARLRDSSTARCRLSAPGSASAAIDPVCRQVIGTSMRACRALGDSGSHLTRNA
jgi:hypothetical protein